MDWSALDPAPLIAQIPDNAHSAEQQMRRFRLADVGEERILDEISGHSVEMLRFDPAYAVRMVSDLVPNPWIAREIVGRLLAGLTARGFAAEKLGAVGGLIVEQLRHWLDGERDRMAETVSERRSPRDEFSSGVGSTPISSLPCNALGRRTGWWCWKRKDRSWPVTWIPSTSRPCCG